MSRAATCHRPRLRAGGVEQGRAVLMRLAAHPATARHIATKLARHFVADDPPASLVDAARQTLSRHRRRSQGSLEDADHVAGSVERAAAEIAQARTIGWSARCAPSASRHPTYGRWSTPQNMLGEPLWRPPAPNGFSDNNAAWMDGLAQRLDIANQFGRRSGDLIDPAFVAECQFRSAAVARHHAKPSRVPKAARRRSRCC